MPNSEAVVNWFKSLPAQLLYSCHWSKNFKLLSINEIKENMSERGLNNFDNLINNQQNNLICFSVGFDWLGVLNDYKGLLEAETKHYWVLVDNENEAFPKLARATVQLMVPFRPIVTE